MLKTGQNEGMEAEEAESFVNHLMKTYDKNNDGRFDYAGMDNYFKYILIGHSFDHMQALDGNSFYVEGNDYIKSQKVTFAHLCPHPFLVNMCFLDNHTAFI